MTDDIDLPDLDDEPDPVPDGEDEGDAAVEIGGEPPPEDDAATSPEPPTQGEPT